MVCPKCKGSFSVEKKRDTCPFCGEMLKREKKPILTVSDGIEEAVEKYGIDILNNKQRLQSYLMDVYPDYVQDKTRMDMAFLLGIGEFVSSLTKISDDEQCDIEIKKFVKKAESSTSLPRDSILDLLDVFLIGAGLISKSQVVKAVAFGGEHTVMLRNNGAVTAKGKNNFGQCDVSAWTDMVGISAGKNHTVGLKKDGTAVCTGDNTFGQCNVSLWCDLRAVAAAGFYTLGLKKDGTVLFAGKSEDKIDGICAEKDIKAVYAGGRTVVGIRDDGTVAVFGENNFGKDVFSQKNIREVAISEYHISGWSYIVMLKNDGTVSAFGENYHGQCDVSSWRDVVSVSAGRFHTVGVNKNGTVYATGDNQFGCCDVGGFKNALRVHAGNGKTAVITREGASFVGKK